MKVTIEKNPDQRLTAEEKKHRVGPGFIYHESSQPLVKLKLLAMNLESEPEVYVNQIEKRIYHVDRLISFLGRFEAAKKGIAFVHGAAVADGDGRGFLIGAQQDVGKTTLSLLLTNNDGYSLIGDDYLDVSQDGYLIREQKKMGLFPHPGNLKHLNLSTKEKLAGFIKYRFFRNPPMCHFVYPNLRVDYQKLKSVCDKAELKKVLILEKGEPGIFEIDRMTAIRKIMATSFDLILPEGFVRRLYYNYCFGNDLPPAWFENEQEKILVSAFKGKQILLLKGDSPFEFHKLFLEHVAD